MIKIVIVEDEPLVRRGLLLTVDWEKLGCCVVGEAENGIEGMEVVKKLDPDIVLTDVRMPGMSGIDMIEKLQDSTEAEFIILSAYSEFAYAKKAMVLGVREYLIKPIDDEELETAVNRAVGYIKEKKKIKNLQNHLEKSDDSKIMLFKEYLSDGETSSSGNLKKAMAFVHENFAEDITIRDVAENLAVSESYLSRLFKKESGYTFNDYLTKYRIKQACRLLDDPHIKVYEVADKVGYKNQRYFSVLFKKIVGKSPGEFKSRGR